MASVPLRAQETPPSAEETQPLLRNDNGRIGSQQHVHSRKYYGMSETTFGYLLLAGSTLGFGLMTLLVHILGDAKFGFGVSPLFIVWSRCIIQLFLSASYVVLCIDFRSHIRRMTSNVKQMLILRGVFGTGGFICLFTSLSILPLGECITIFYLSPIFTIIGAAMTLGESFTVTEVIASLVAFAGVALISHPNGAAPSSALDVSSTQNARLLPSVLPSSLTSVMPQLSRDGVGVVLALAGAILAASAYTTVRAMGVRVHFMFSVLSLGLVGTVVATLLLSAEPATSGILQGLGDAIRRPTVGLLLALQAAVAFLGQCLLNKGLQHCRAAGVLIRNLDVPLAYLFGICLLGEIPSWWSTAGSVLVLGAVAGISIKHALQS